MSERTDRMARAVAEWKVAQRLFREAKARFGAAVDAHRDHDWGDDLRRDVAEMAGVMETARQAAMAADQLIETAKLLDRQAWIHGTEPRPCCC